MLGNGTMPRGKTKNSLRPPAVKIDGGSGVVRAEICPTPKGAFMLSVERGMSGIVFFII